jgi:hypothetical protein
VDVWEYFQSRERECRELSLVPDGTFAQMCSEEEGSGGQRGIFFGRLNMTEQAFLSAFEVIQVTGTGVHRVRYSYYLVMDEAEVWGFDRDPDHDPPLHRHQGVSHKRFPCRRMRFGEVARFAWETVSAEEGLGTPSCSFEADPQP